jgi:hypothetical protein
MNLDDYLNEVLASSEADWKKYNSRSYWKAITFSSC